MGKKKEEKKSELSDLEKLGLENSKLRNKICELERKKEFLIQSNSRLNWIIILIVLAELLDILFSKFQ